MGYKIWPKIIGSTTLSQSQKRQSYHPSISIELLESVLYSHQAHHPVLRGVVEIKSKEPLVVSSLRLDFHGHLDYCLVKPEVSCQKKFAECSLPLYPAAPSVIHASSLSNPLVIQDQGDKPVRCVFEMPLPNRTVTTNSNSRQSSLIPSIWCKEVRINYQIRAVLEYHRLCDTQDKETYNKSKKRESSTIRLTESPSYPIVVIQIPTYDDGSAIFTSDNMLSSIDSQKQSNHWCQFHIKVDRRFAAISSMLSLSVHLAPLIHGLKLAQVSTHIVQRFIITHPDGESPSPQTFSRPPIPLECHYQSTPYPSSSSKHHTGGTLYEGSFQYKIPSNSSTSTATLLHQANTSGLVPSIQANALSNINVEHHLVVYLAVTYPKMSHDGILRRARRILTFQCDFNLLHPCMADHISDELLRLPTYDVTVPTTVSTKIQQHNVRRSATLANEFFHYNRHQSSSPRPPKYDQAVLLPPVVHTIN